MELAVLKVHVEDLSGKVESLTGEVRELLNAWRGAMWLVNVVKVVGGIAVAITGVWALLKGLAK